MPPVALSRLSVLIFGNDLLSFAASLFIYRLPSLVICPSQNTPALSASMEFGFLWGWDGNETHSEMTALDCLTLASQF